MGTRRRRYRLAMPDYAAPKMFATMCSHSGVVYRGEIFVPIVTVYCSPVDSERVKLHISLAERPGRQRSQPSTAGHGRLSPLLELGRLSCSAYGYRCRRAALDCVCRRARITFRSWCAQCRLRFRSTLNLDLRWPSATAANRGTSACWSKFPFQTAV